MARDQSTAKPHESEQKDMKSQIDDEKCSECGHPWGSHQGHIPMYVVCRYSAYGGYHCPCKRMDPAEEAENARASYLWKAFTT